MFIEMLTTLARKVNGPRRGLCMLCWQPKVVNTLINKKVKFIAYIYIRFNQNLDEKSYIRAKIEAIKQLHAVFLLQTAEERRRPIR